MKKSIQGKKSPGKSGSWLFLCILVLSFAVSISGGYFYFRDRLAFESSFIAEIESRQIAAASAKQKKHDLRLYAADEAGSGSVSRKDAMLVAAEETIRKHMKPYSVRLLDLYMDREGTVYIDFGDELKKNFRGDALEELGILGGLYKGIKAAVPGFKAIKILIEGREAESFGGHIDISKPLGGEIAESI